jgi:tRNA dimethylallyltransferase
LTSNATTVTAVLGPTGSGKAELAAAAARATGAICLSCDSMKVYRGMDVGTAKPTGARLEGVDWRGLDEVPPCEAWNASRFRERFDACLEEARGTGRPLLLSGGTMLYLKAATEGLDAAPPRDEALRARLRAEAEAAGSPALHARLAQVDAASAGRIHPNDLRRIVRALEVYELTGEPQSASQGRFGRVREDVRRVVFVVERTREDMDARIDRRVERMFAAGWVEECRRLRADPRGLSTEAAQAIGYREILAWLEAGEAEPEAGLIERIQTATRRFARKQLTWIRHLPEVHTLHVAPGESPLGYVERVVESLRRGGGEAA